MIFKVDTSKIVALTNRLEKLNRSAFPVAVRGTLNDAAYSVKTDTMPQRARGSFEHREKNFFKANSKFIKAEGFDLNTMRSDVGFYENKLKNQGTNYAIDDLNQQEVGGVIKKKSFIPATGARTSAKGNVRPNARLSVIKKFIKERSKNDEIKTAIVAGVGGFVLRDGNLFQIKALIKEGRKTRFKAIRLYSFKKGRTVTVKPTHFMSEASKETANKMDDFYIKQALKQFKKAGIIK